ncbi:hypothetical protein DERP_006375 [Dermatophagoides pteronyssinus]|uniref:Uncharacterized protein n=1 Tax=Dermatophagoides pteronyssinus TaxID=6956 RepID=A0ABQ8IY88_DERPT|nr:hypothetical protein DERP_006375 [Dermatophagoides pteronyssinus]
MKISSKSSSWIWWMFKFAIGQPFSDTFDLQIAMEHQEQQTTANNQHEDPLLKNVHIFLA